MPRLKKKELVDVIIDAGFDKKAEEIVSIDLKKVESRFCEHFVICHALSNVHVQSIADGIYRMVKKEMHISPNSYEGYENASWILLDYGNVVAHIFKEYDRRHYDLEKLWSDGKIKKHFPAKSAVMQVKEKAVKKVSTHKIVKTSKRITATKKSK